MIAAVYQVLPDQTLGKYKFLTTSATATSLDLSSNHLHKIIGFERAIYAFSSLALLSVNIVNLQLTSVIQVNSDIVGGTDQILSEIVGTTVPYSQVNYKEIAPAYANKQFRQSGSNVFTFWITDDRETLLDLNGLDFQIVICLYKKDRTALNNQLLNRINFISDNIS
jgi:hypothetical protein